MTRSRHVIGYGASLLVPLLVLSFLVGCREKRAPRAPSPGRAHFKVMTYNVNFGLAGDDETLAAIDDWADLVLLQETNDDWEQHLRGRLAKQYPHMAFRHCCRAGGLGVLSKHPFEDKEYIEPKAGWFPAWRLVVDSPLGKLQVLNLHLHPPVSEGGSVVSGYFTTPAVREAEISQYFPHLDPSLPTIVAGDFNESAGGRAIVYLEERGFRSALPQFAGSQNTWRWQTSVGTVRSQLDHIVYNDKLEPLQVQVQRRGRSDHLPVRGLFVLDDRKQ